MWLSDRSESEGVRENPNSRSLSHQHPALRLRDIPTKATDRPGFHGMSQWISKRMTILITWKTYQSNIL